MQPGSLRAIEKAPCPLASSRINGITALHGNETLSLWTPLGGRNCGPGAAGSDLPASSESVGQLVRSGLDVSPHLGMRRGHLHVVTALDKWAPLLIMASPDALIFLCHPDSQENGQVHPN